MKTASIILSILLAVLLVPCMAQTRINPATQINWPALTGNGAPSSSLCNAASLGQRYVDIQNSVQYVCGSSGWFTGAGASFSPSGIQFAVSTTSSRLATPADMGAAHLDGQRNWLANGTQSGSTILSGWTDAFIAGYGAAPLWGTQAHTGYSGQQGLVAIGSGACASCKWNNGSVAIGYYALNSAVGGVNPLPGEDMNTVAIGPFACMSDNGSGFENVCIGNKADSLGNGMNSSVFVGTHTQWTGGTGVTLLGSNIGWNQGAGTAGAVETGNYNTLVGSGILNPGTSGTYGTMNNATIVGANSATNAFNVSDLTVLGYNIGANVSGSSNLLIGENIPGPTTGTNNTIISMESSGAQSIGAASNITGVGANVFHNATSPSNSTAFGSSALGRIAGSSNSDAFGYSAGNGNGGTYTNVTAIGAFSMNGCTNSPSADVAIGQSALVNTTSCPSNSVLIGSGVSNNTTVGNSNVIIGHNAQRTADGGSNVVVGDSASVSAGVTGAAVIGSSATNSHSNTMQFNGWNFLSSSGDATFRTVSYSVGTSIASASTIAPVTGIVHVTGSAQINTITVPSVLQGGTGFTGCIILIPDGPWTMGTSGNIAVAVTAITGQQVKMCYDGTKWYPSNTGIQNATQRGVDAVRDIGLDNTGTNDVSAALSAYLSGKNGVEIYFPCGTYKFTNGLQLTATNTTSEGLSFIGESTASYTGGASASYGCVFFTYNGGGANKDLLWFDNQTSNSTNYNGPKIQNINFIDTSGTGAVHSLLRITQFSNWITDNLGFQNATGSIYTAGTVTVTNGSNVVTGTGTLWQTTGIPQYGTHFQVGGHIVEVASIDSDTQLHLTSNWDYASASGSAYAIDYNGVGILLEGNSGSGFTQYGTISNFKSYNNRVFAHLQGGTTSAQGAYDISLDQGYINCNRVTDSQAVFIGHFDGQFNLSNYKVNNCARFLTSEGAQGITATFRAENTGAFTPVTTCNGGTAAQSCVSGIVFNDDTTSVGTKNKVVASNIVNTGVAIEFDEGQTQPSSHAKGIIGNGFTSNLANYQWPDGTQGCETSNHSAYVLEQDCTVFQSQPVVNPPLDQVANPQASKTFDVDANLLTFRSGQNASTTGNSFTFRDASGNTGTGTLFTVQTFSGTSGMQPINIQGAASQWYISRTGNMSFQSTTPATSGSNVNSMGDNLCGNFWNGSASGSDCFTWQNILGTGANPTETLTLTHSGSSSSPQVSFSGVGLVTFSSSSEGRATLSSGTATVSTVWASTSRVFSLTNCGVSGTQGMLSVGTVTPGVSFVINSSSAADNSTVCWSIH